MGGGGDGRGGVGGVGGLTDYERKQEEEAIISYDELLKVKDKIYNITDDEETDEFIDELKNFRIDLQ